MLCTPNGLALIRESEGLRLSAYLDGGGVPTIGYGHTAGVRLGQTITVQQAEQLLLWDVDNAEATIIRFTDAATRSLIAPGGMDALVDATFNLGAQLWRNKDGSSTGLCRAITARQWDQVPVQLMRWNKDNGKEVDGLTRRRRKECGIWRAAMHV